MRAQKYLKIKKILDWGDFYYWKNFFLKKLSKKHKVKNDKKNNDPI